MKKAEMDLATLAQLDTFDEVIDVRTASEFSEDHIPGAVNFPVLSDDERARVGTLYKQVSPFDAKKVGAALIARNVAAHLDRDLARRPRDWRPLVYCWRGGKRSGAMVHILREIGWHACRLDGGYRAYRRAVLADLETLPAHLSWRVICGPTGTGKTRLLGALAAAGAQVLDLEGLARHRGSVLGEVPGEPQPPQKMFESVLWNALRRLSPGIPVFVEAESRKIGRLRVSEALIQAMWGSPCVRLEADLPVRVALLKADYGHFVGDATLLGTRLDWLSRLHGGERIARWRALALAGDWDTLVAELLVQHYDPSYLRSTLSHYPTYGEAPQLRVESPDNAAFDALARRALGLIVRAPEQ